MTLVLSHISAARFWRSVYPLHRALGEAPEATRVERGVLTDDDVWTLAPTWVTKQFLRRDDGMLHTLSFERDGRRRSKTHVPHVWSGALPSGSLYECDEDVFVCSPGFVFLQAAECLNVIQLAAFACELCGVYSFDPQADRGFNQRGCPLTQVAKLEWFLKGAKGMRNQRKALSALRFAIDGAASPMETTCFLLLTLPYRLGGYGLPIPSMNEEIPLTDRARMLCENSFCKGDLCWSGASIDVEYLGEQDHSGASAMRLDRARVNALVEMGYEVIELTSQQVKDPDAFEVIALRIADKVGKRVRAEGVGETPARQKLRKTLFEWNRSSGSLSRRSEK